MSIPVLLNQTATGGFTKVNNYYDRNQVTISSYYVSGAVAPHGSHQSIHYTVPSGKLAFIDSIMLYSERDSVASPSNYAGEYVEYIPNGGGNIVVIERWYTDNALGPRFQFATNQMGIMLPGDQISIFDDDTSTGGTCWFEASIKFVQFDK